MAETGLSDDDLGRLERDLDELILPDFETIRALVAETRLSRRLIGHYTTALTVIDAAVHRAQRETL